MDQNQRSISDCLNKLSNKEILSKSEAYEILLDIGKGNVSPYQATALLYAYTMRTISGDELSGFRKAMIELAIPIDFSDLETIDIVGTGGDGKNTFNISTCSAIVAAGAGYKVAKHGNYGVSSNSGSSNVLTELGYNFSNDESILRAHIEGNNFCFFHAPLFHPAMKEVGPIRKGLGIKTIFNIMGPLLNPSKPKRQFSGVFDPIYLPLYKAVFEDAGMQYAVVYSTDGYDEISLTAPFEIRSNQFDGIINPDQLGLPKLTQESLYGGNTPKEAANIFYKIISGDGTAAQNQVVYINAGYAIQQFKPDASIEDCIAEAKEAIDNGNALKVVNQFA